MRFLLTLYIDESMWDDTTPEAADAMMAGYEAFGRDIMKAKVFLAGDGLQPTDTARTVRVRDGQRRITEGPFAKTEEQLGGFYVLDCEDIEEALGWAAKIPAALVGSVEVRPVLDYS